MKSVLNAPHSESASIRRHRESVSHRQPNNFMRIDPEYSDTWGSSFWITAHVVAAAYPKTPTLEDKEHFKLYYDSFGYILPCHECKDNWNVILEQNPLTEASLSTRITLSKWVFDVHNLVNENLGKSPYSWKQLVYRFKGIEDEITSPYPQKMIKKISLSPESVSGSNIIPDTSLGIVGLKTPSAWRNAMVHVNNPPKRAVQYVSIEEKNMQPGLRRKKCGCGK